MKSISRKALFITLAIFIIPFMVAATYQFPVNNFGALGDLIGYDNNNNTFSSSNVVANADGSVLERQEYIQNALEGSYITVQSTVVSSGIPNNTQTAGAITGAASGALLLREIHITTDSTGLAGPTNFEISTDNADGLTGAGAPIVLEAAAGVGASKCWSAASDATTEYLPLNLESGKKLYIHGDDAAGTGAGEAIVTMVFQRVSAGSSITAANIAAP